MFWAIAFAGSGRRDGLRRDVRADDLAELQSRLVRRSPLGLRDDRVRLRDDLRLRSGLHGRLERLGVACPARQRRHGNCGERASGSRRSRQHAGAERRGVAERCRCLSSRRSSGREEYGRRLSRGVEDPPGDARPAPALDGGACAPPRGERRARRPEARAPPASRARRAAASPLGKLARPPRPRRVVLLQPAGDLRQSRVVRDDRRTAGGSSLGGDHPEGLGKDRRDDSDVGEREEMHEVPVLERAGEEDVETGGLLLELVRGSRRSRRSPRARPSTQRLEQDLHALVLDQLAVVDDGRPVPARGTPRATSRCPRPGAARSRSRGSADRAAPLREALRERQPSAQAARARRPHRVGSRTRGRPSRRLRGRRRGCARSRRSSPPRPRAPRRPRPRVRRFRASSTRAPSRAPSRRTRRRSRRRPRPRAARD